LRSKKKDIGKKTFSYEKRRRSKALLSRADAFFLSNSKEGRLSQFAKNVFFTFAFSFAESRQKLCF
jgi:hypothetical protein